MNFLLIAGFGDSVLRFRGELIKDLVARGLVVHVAIPGSENNQSLGEELQSVVSQVHEIPLERTGTNPIRDIQLLWHLFRLIRRTEPQFVMGYTIKPVIFGSLAAWLSRVPHRFALVTGAGYALANERNGLLSSLVRPLYSFALSKVEKVIFQNIDDQGLFRQLGILPDHIPSAVVNGSGVDVSVYQSSPLPEGHPSFLMIGRLLGDKGLREYAQAARRIRQSFPDTKFQLVGWIDENPDSISQDELDAWVESGDIDFLGRLDDVRPAISEATVYVLPSYREGTPRTVLEAMAMGRPIITTDAPGCRETVIDGENGFLVEPRSVDDLVDAMQRFIDDPDLGARMGRRSREIAEEKYNVHKVNALMLREMGITSADG